MLKFRDMKKSQFQEIIQGSYLQGYIADLSVYEDAIFKETGKTSREFAEGHVFWMVVDDEADVEVGHMWITMHSELQVSILGEIEVTAGHRNKGYGTRMLEEWENYVRRGYPSYHGLLLHVFGHNPDARRLYERFGFTVHDETYHGWNLVKLLHQ